MELKSDCSRCAALCCIAYPSDTMPGFSARKEAGERCPKLDAYGLCTIYNTRQDEGFGGCVGYECFGAGQHVVQSLFEGRDWRTDPAILPQMVEAFLAMRPVSDLLYLADRARNYSITREQAIALDRVTNELVELAGTRDGLRETAAIAKAEAVVRKIYRESLSIQKTA